MIQTAENIKTNQATLFDSIVGMPCMVRGGKAIGLVRCITWIRGEQHIHCIWPQEEVHGKRQQRVRRWMADSIWPDRDIIVLSLEEALKMEDRIAPLIRTMEFKNKELNPSKSKRVA